MNQVVGEMSFERVKLGEIVEKAQCTHTLPSRNQSILQRRPHPSTPQVGGLSASLWYSTYLVRQTIMERQKLDSRELKGLEAIFLLLVLYNVDMSSCQVSYAHLGNSFLGCFCYDNYLAQQNIPRHITTVQKCSAMQPVRPSSIATVVCLWIKQCIYV